mgnify:CR=1 FL=1|jgi:uncharacterized lipoprotein YehR (DUF1307 family)
MKTSILKRLFLFLILFSLTLGLTGCQNTEQTKSVQSFISGVAVADDAYKKSMGVAYMSMNLSENGKITTSEAYQQLEKCKALLKKSRPDVKNLKIDDRVSQDEKKQMAHIQKGYLDMLDNGIIVIDGWMKYLNNGNLSTEMQTKLIKSEAKVDSSERFLHSDVTALAKKYDIKLPESFNKSKEEQALKMKSLIFPDVV